MVKKQLIHHHPHWGLPWRPYTHWSTQWPAHKTTGLCVQGTEVTTSQYSVFPHIELSQRSPGHGKDWSRWQPTQAHVLPNTTHWTPVYIPSPLGTWSAQALCSELSWGLSTWEITSWAIRMLVYRRSEPNTRLSKAPYWWHFVTVCPFGPWRLGLVVPNKRHYWPLWAPPPLNITFLSAKAILPESRSNLNSCQDQNKAKSECTAGRTGDL